MPPYLYSCGRKQMAQKVTPNDFLLRTRQDPHYLLSCMVPCLRHTCRFRALYFNQSYLPVHSLGDFVYGPHHWLSIHVLHLTGIHRWRAYILDPYRTHTHNFQGIFRQLRNKALTQEEMWEKPQRAEYIVLSKTVSIALDFPQRRFRSVSSFSGIPVISCSSAADKCATVAEGQWPQGPPLESASAQLRAYSQDGDIAVLGYILQQAASCVILSKTEEKEEDCRQSRSPWGREATVNHTG